MIIIKRIRHAISSSSIQNRIRLFSAGVPRGVLTPLVANDLYVAHQSLWRFYAAFAVRKNALLVIDNAGAASASIARSALAEVTAVIPSRRRLAYAVRALETDSVTFRSDLPLFPSHTSRQAPNTHDLAITDSVLFMDVERALDTLLSPNGVFLVRLTPEEANSKVWQSAMERLRRRFGAALMFGQFARVPLDLANPRPSTMRLTDFEFAQLEEGTIPANAITIINVFSGDKRWANLRLHLGAGPLALEDWVNIDNQPYGGVNFMWDLAGGLPFRNAEFIFAEHFLEHLPFDDAGALLRQCRAALSPNGVLRLSTPNLDWVWKFGYHLGAWAEEREAVRDCFVLNRAFRGWGHQFLYNHATLGDALRRAGFAEIRSGSYGSSEFSQLRSLERHEQYPDEPAVPHVLILEASGTSDPIVSPYLDLIEEFRRDKEVY